MLRFGGESGGYFRALLMRERGSAPNIWLSIATNPPAGAGDERCWLVTLHGNQHGARIEDSQRSPISVDPAFAGRHLKRDELLSVPGAPEFYFECFDVLLAQHSRLAAFVLQSAVE